MIAKFISLAMAVCSIELLILGLQSPDDPLLLIISSNPVLMVLRLLLVLAAVRLAFKNRFKYKISQSVLAFFGALLMFMGLCGMFSQKVADELSVYIKYMDFWMLFLVGLVFALVSLTIIPGYRRLRVSPVVFQHLPKAWASKFDLQSYFNLKPVKKA